MQHANRSPGRLSLFTIPVIVGIGFLMGMLSNSGFGNDWFDQLAMPRLIPAGWVFGAAWTILYVLLGIALAFALDAPTSRPRNFGILLFLIQLALNFSWSPVFFGAHEVKIALAAIASMLLLAIISAVALSRVKPVIAWLMAPYLAWLCFATYLNFEIMRLNPGV